MTVPAGGSSTVQDLSVSPARASLLTLLVSLPLTALLIAAYGAIAARPGAPPLSLSPVGLGSLLAALVLGVFAHEGLHALGWAWFGHLPIKAIKLGFQVRTLTPYAHATVPMNAQGYRWGSALPALVLGALPFVVGTTLGRPGIAAFGILLTFAAGGDLLVLWLIRKVDGRAHVLDHPSRVGCILLGLEDTTRPDGDGAPLA